MRTDVPVNHFAAGDTRKAISSAISSGLPYRLMPASAGNLFVASSTVMLWAGAHFSMKDRRRPVITGPGTTLLTRIPSLMPCSAKALARAMMAALIVATAAKPGLGSKAALPEIRTTDPLEALTGLLQLAA